MSDDLTGSNSFAETRIVESHEDTIIDTMGAAGSYVWNLGGGLVSEFSKVAQDPALSKGAAIFGVALALIVGAGLWKKFGENDYNILTMAGSALKNTGVLAGMALGATLLLGGLGTWIQRGMEEGQVWNSYTDTWSDMARGVGGIFSGNDEPEYDYQELEFNLGSSSSRP